MTLVDFGVMTGVIIALVAWIKEKFGVQGKPVEIVSMALGLVFGGAYQLVQATKGIPLPVDWNGWLTLILNVLIAGFGMGLTASGLYKTDKEITTKSIIKSTQVNAGNVPAAVSHTPPEILEQINRAMKS